MGWFSDYVMELRGAPSNDYDDEAAIDVTISVLGLLPVPAIAGEIDETGAGAYINRTEKRLEIYVVPRPFGVLSRDATTDDLQDFGYLWRLLYYVLPSPYLWIKGVWKDGSDHGEGVIPRALMDPTSGLTDNDFWETEISFPLQVVLDGEAKPSPKFEDGTAELEFKLTKALPED